MKQTSVIYDPPDLRSTYVAAVFDPNGAVIASRAFPSRTEAHAFLQAFLQENAGEHGLVISKACPAEGP
jgi:hypothetical protein